MGWIARRDAYHDGIPGLWNSLCDEVSTVVQSFCQTKFARHRSVQASVLKSNNSVKLVRSEGKMQRSIRITLDVEGARVISVSDFSEQKYVQVLAKTESGPYFAGPDGMQMSLDEVSEYFLDKFLFE